MTVITSPASAARARDGDADLTDAPGAVDAPIPLVVDVDGTMVRGDLFWEGVASMLLRTPHRLAGVAGTVPRGRAAVKAAVAGHVPLEPDHLPYTPEVLALVEEARAAGRPIVIASGSDRAYVLPLAERIGAEAVLAPDGGTVNLIGRHKLAALQERFPAFDYVGDARVDLPLWTAARTAYVANPKPSTLRALGATGRAYTLLTPARRSGRELVRALRPHQWAKNALLLAPALTAHLTWSAGLIVRLLLGFVAFSLAASAIYLVNDLADLPHDRRHPRKRRRPLAAGTLPVTTALAAVPVLLGVALTCALLLPGAFAPTLAAYVVLSVSYSFYLKRRLLVDVVVLSMLYSVRVIGGGEIAGVTLSRWFVAFALFLFFALAAVKRVVELRDLAVRSEGGLAAALAAGPTSDGRLSGRAYAPVDWLVLTAMGSAASAASCVVYCLYVASPGVETLYARPDLLWPGLPLLLYWQARVWIFTVRGSLHDDPIAFALRDRVSWAVAAALGLCVWLAA